MKCPVCGKDKTLYEMRPLINVRELSIGNQLSEQKAEQEIGGAKLQMVCRNCWQAILDSKDKSEVIEILETLSALLLELDRRQREQAKLAQVEERIEKSRARQPILVPFDLDQWRPNTEGPTWVIGSQGNTKINWASIQSLGDDLTDMTCSIQT